MYEGWYCVSEETFYPEAQLRERPDGVKVTLEDKPVEWVAEENYKFRLSAFQDEILSWLCETSGTSKSIKIYRYRNTFFSLCTAIYPTSAKGALLGALQRDQGQVDGLDAAELFKDISISRLSSKLSWGIPVPDDPNHTIYVWFDALMNYITSSASLEKGNGGHGKADNASKFFIHVLGKDITRFHAIFWPGFLLATGNPLPRQLLIHAHWRQGDTKMSKSLGNVVDPAECVAKVGVDSLRFYLLKTAKWDSDTGTLIFTRPIIGADTLIDFTMASMEDVHENDLVHLLGNLTSRLLNPSFFHERQYPVKPTQFVLDHDKEMVLLLESLPSMFNECK